MSPYKQRNVNFSHLIHRLLFAEESFITGDIIPLQNTFVSQLNELFPAIFDITAEAKQLNSLNVNAIKKDKQALTTFLTNLFESDDAYIILNFYYTGFITSFLKQMKSEHGAMLPELLSAHDITEKDFTDTFLAYEELIQRKKKTS